MVLEKYEDYDWKELPKLVREAATVLGYTRKHWERDKEPEVCQKDWKELTESQREAAKKLGYSRETWDEDTDSSSSSSSSSSESEDEEEAKTVLDKYEDYKWKEVPEWVREAATILGYTKKLSDRDKEPLTCKKDWDELTDSEREACKKLGYTQQLWDQSTLSRVCPAFEDVHKHFKWTIYCIQLYTETPDYQFRVNEGTGLSMHTNRPVEAEEAIVQSSVGPDVFEQLFEMDQTGVMTEERKGFAERFLEWQKTHQSMNRVGAQNGNITVKLEDFSNIPITSKKYRPMPGKKSLLYDLEIFEHEVVIVEFIPPPSNPNYELPAHRRFEILHYDEGLVGLDGEEGYDPRTMKRPPTLCGMEERSLELPGHFTNHASGATSTAFDFLSEERYTEFPPGHGDNLPEWLVKEMTANKRAAKHNKSENLLLSRRALEPGTEITTDYSRWHWSNADYSYGISRKTPIGFFLGDANSMRWDWSDLSPKIKRAAHILGFTEVLWDSGETPSTFEKSWNNLSLQEQEAAVNLTGHNKKSWNEGKGFDLEEDSMEVVGVLNEVEWSKLSEDQKKAAIILGHNETSWNKGDHDCFMNESLYWYNLRPEHRDALVVLGETEITWNDDEEDDDEDEDSEPWFYCLCGDSDCHSSKERGGFRGVEYFPVEEQRKLAPFCDSWVQQSIAWRMYQLEQKEKERPSSMVGQKRPVAC